MNFIRLSRLLLIFLQINISIDAFSFAKIINSNFSSGVPFAQINVMKPTVCTCSCFDHPHCLSIVVIRLNIDSFFCQLFATYPSQTNQISFSTDSNVSLFTERILRSTKLFLNNKLISPSGVFSTNSTNTPWIPLFVLRPGNNQSFLWVNSSVSTSVSSIPDLFVNKIETHWFNVLVSQWNQGTYRPEQVALAFFVNQTSMIDFLIFNASQSDIFSWFSISRLISTQFWSILSYRDTNIGQTQMKSIYQDSDSTRSFNCNFKTSSTSTSSNSCSMDFFGFFFVYGGFRDQCISAVRNISQLPIPTLFYSPTRNYTMGNLNQFSQAFGLFVFVR